jgi:hypothetical protein
LVWLQALGYQKGGVDEKTFQPFAGIFVFAFGIAPIHHLPSLK